MPVTKKKSPSIRRGSYPDGVRQRPAPASGRLPEAPLGGPHGLVGEFLRVTAPDQQRQAAPALTLRIAPDPSLTQQGDRPVEFPRLVLPRQRRLDVLARHAPALQRVGDPLRAPTRQLALVGRVAPREARVVDRSGLGEQGDHLLDLALLDPALGEPAAQLRLRALLVAQRAERQLV